MPTLPLRKKFRELMLDRRNRRSTNIEDRRFESKEGVSPLDSAGYGHPGHGIVAPDLNQPVPLFVDFASISPHEREVARYRAEESRIPNPFRRRRK